MGEEVPYRISIHSTESSHVKEVCMYPWLAMLSLSRPLGCEVSYSIVYILLKFSCILHAGMLEIYYISHLNPDISLNAHYEALDKGIPRAHPFRIK